MNHAEHGFRCSDVWALFTEFDVYFSDGDVNNGDSEVGGRMLFQPILPFPLYGSGEHDFGQRAQIKLNLIPVIPSLVENPIFGGG
jgi:hypothetical protein